MIASRMMKAGAVLAAFGALTACTSPAERERSAALNLVTKEFAGEPVYSDVTQRIDPVGRKVVCGTASGPKEIPVPVKANEPPRTKPLFTRADIKSRFFVVDGEAVLEHQDSLYTGANPAVQGAADDYMKMTIAWFEVGWQALCVESKVAQS